MSEFARDVAGEIRHATATTCDVSHLTGVQPIFGVIEPIVAHNEA
jgi:hypothetical protein